MKNIVLGIDLGTTNSCVSIIENGIPKIIENSEGQRTTPSIVAFKDDEIIVGAGAKRQSVTNPENTIFAAKRLIGRRFEDEEVKKELSKVPYKIIKSDNGDAWVDIKGKKIAPQQISADILRKMKKTAEDYTGQTITDAVITVPAYFNDAQRQATKDAGAIAGLNVLRIINEPTAAALAFGVDKIEKDTKIVVYDLGGGTFDVSVIDVTTEDGEKQFEVLSTNGDTFLGGEDFDQRLIDYLIESFKKDQNIDLRNDPLALQRLKEAAEKAKIELSSAQQTDINLPYITADSNGPKHFSLKLTRAKLEALVEDLILKTLEPCKIALKDSGLIVSEIEDIILVGGQTRMPKVQEAVKNFFGKEPRKDINPDEAVSVGAAIQGSVLSGERKDVLLLDVTPLSLGIETMGGIMTTLISKNTTIPTKNSEVFSTAEDNQPAVTIKIYQGERKLAKDNHLLGEFNLEGISSAPRGTPQIEVSLDIDSNGIIKVSAKDKNTGKENNITIKANSGLTEKEIEEMIQQAKLNESEDNRLKELAETKNIADSLIHNVKKENNNPSVRLQAAISKLEEEVIKGDISSLKEAINTLSKTIEEESKVKEDEQDKNKDSVIDAEFEEK